MEDSIDRKKFCWEYDSLNRHIRMGKAFQKLLSCCAPHFGNWLLDQAHMLKTILCLFTVFVTDQINIMVGADSTLI